MLKPSAMKTGRIFLKLLALALLFSAGGAIAQTTVCATTTDNSLYGYLGEGCEGAVNIPAPSAAPGATGGAIASSLPPGSVSGVEQAICMQESSCSLSVGAGGDGGGLYQFQSATLASVCGADWNSGNCGGATSLAQFQQCVSCQNDAFNTYASQQWATLNSETCGSGNCGSDLVGQTVTLGGQTITLTQGEIESGAWNYGAGGFASAIQSGTNIQSGSNPTLINRMEACGC